MNLAEAVNHVRPCIVQINFVATGLADGRPIARAPLGTGFLINSEGYAITANHVVEGGHQLIRRIEARRKQLSVGLATPNTENMRANFRYVVCDVADKDERHDLALLKLKENPFEGKVRSGFIDRGKEVPLIFGTATLNPDRPNDGASIGVSGYPMKQNVLVSNSGCMATSWAYDVEEVSVPGAPEWFRRPGVADFYLADVEANRGNSGGPVYLSSNGSVIGVCVSSLLTQVCDEHGRCQDPIYYSSGLTVVIPTKYVVELSSKHSPS